MPVVYLECGEYFQKYEEWVKMLSDSSIPRGQTDNASISSHIARIFGEVRKNIGRVPYDQMCKAELYDCVNEVESSMPLPEDLKQQVGTMRNRFEALTHRIPPIERVGGSRSFLTYINGAMDDRLTDEFNYNLNDLARNLSESPTFRIDYRLFFDLMVNQDDQLRSDNTIEQMAQLFYNLHKKLKLEIWPYVIEEREVAGSTASHTTIENEYSNLLLKIVGAMLETTGRYNLRYETKGSGISGKTVGTRRRYGGTRKHIESEKLKAKMERAKSGRKCRTGPTPITHMIICTLKDEKNVHC